MNAHSRRAARGFSLIELTVTLVILGIIGVLLVRWLSQMNQIDHIEQERTLLQRADDALLAFSAANARLPCPAPSGGGGVEDCALGQTGWLPWRTLGLPEPRAGQLWYGVLRRANGQPAQDADLAVTKDRAWYLQVTATSNVQIGAVMASPACLGATANAPDCTTHPELRDNSLDFCLALRTASLLPASDDYIHDDGAIRHRNMAYAVAAPSQTQLGAASVPLLFPAPQQAQQRPADEQQRTLAVGADQLWSRLRCGESLGAVTFAHANIGGAAALMAASMDDYREQLEIMLDMSHAGDNSADAGLISAAAQISSSVAGLLDTVGEDLEDNGATSWRTGVAGVGIGSAVGTMIAAAVMKAKSQEFLNDTQDRLQEFVNDHDFQQRSKTLRDDINYSIQRADMQGAFPTPAAQQAAAQIGVPVTPPGS